MKVEWFEEELNPYEILKGRNEYLTNEVKRFVIKYEKAKEEIERLTAESTEWESKCYKYQDIIKEVRDYATQHMMELAKRKGINGEENGAIYVAVADLLEILDKENEWKQ